MYIILPIFILVLLWLGVQDLKDRSYYFLFFPLLIILAFVYNYLLKENGLTFYHIGINLIYIFITLVALQLYYFIKQKRFIPITKDAFALGDIFILLVISLLLPLEQLIGFVLLSSLIGIIFHFINTNTFRKKGIPFAGIVAFLLVPILILKLFI